MTERLQEILNRKPSKWGNLTVKEFERDIKLLQERVGELEKKVQRYEQKFEEILELGWTENFGGSYVNMGEYHADAIQIAESALGRSKRND